MLHFLAVMTMGKIRMRIGSIRSFRSVDFEENLPRSWLLTGNFLRGKYLLGRSAIFARRISGVLAQRRQE